MRKRGVGLNLRDLSRPDKVKGVGGHCASPLPKWVRRRHIGTFTFPVSIPCVYIYIYIYVCVCVCVCVKKKHIIKLFEMAAIGLSRLAALSIKISCTCHPATVADQPKIASDGTAVARP